MDRYTAACALVSVSLSVVGVRAQSPSAAPSLTHSPSAFPDVLNPYRPNPIPPLQLENSPRLQDLLRNGTISLSLSQALALALENNLDIAVQRYIRPIAEADMLRTSSGQAARGIPGALVPPGLSAGALGVGVNQSAGTGGVGAAGGISGGGGAVSVPQVGTFDPTVSFSASYDNTASPLNSTVVAGVPQVTTQSSASSVNYTQLFPQGASMTLTVNGIAQNSTQQALLFNPAVVSRLAAAVNQPLLNGAGFLANRRFLLVAGNNLSTSDQLFREQVTSVIIQVENTYWGLAAARLAVDAATRSFNAATELVDDTKTRVQFGTAAGVDVIAAESAAASAERDLIVARTDLALQVEQLKSLISKSDDKTLEAANIDTVDELPNPNDLPVPDVDTALQTALAKRPELLAAAQDLRNQDISVRYTKNGLLPTVSVFALYAGAGLTGDTPVIDNGLRASLHQTFDAAYPEYAAGISAALPLRNRSAQADNLRARLEEQQLQVQQQRSRQQIELEVRQAVIGLAQGKAQVEAAHKALELADRTAAAEREKLQVGVSTAYDVILRERDLVAAKEADVAASATYARALVEFNRATGATLDANGIAMNDAMAGHVEHAPTPAGLATPAPEARR
ncbi:MAG TPA: TolC family protein [Vicinamibacterales bacterium]|nr:TolC family protein [Vicinamibacterales bacterium]